MRRASCRHQRLASFWRRECSHEDKILIKILIHELYYLHYITMCTACCNILIIH